MRYVHLIVGIGLLFLLTGSSLFGQTPSVELEWDPNPPADQVVGYNLYRSEQSGSGYVRLNSNLIPATSYTDGTILAGHTYYYVCTAVNGDDLESGFSNQVPYSVPGGDVCLGDVNGDGSRNVIDAVRTEAHIVHLVTLEGDDLAAADLNGDGSVNAIDSVLFRRFAVNLDPWPICQ